LELDITIEKKRTYLVAEAPFVLLDLPNTYNQQYGDQQCSVFLDEAQPIIKRKIFG